VAYVHVLTDLAGNAVSELPAATGKQTEVPLNAMGTSTVTVRNDSPDADLLLEGDKLVKVYDVNDDFLTDGSKALIAHHRLITAEEVASDGSATVAASFADPYWVLLRRLIGKTAAGYTRGTSLAPVDRGTIVTELLDATNAEGASGVRAGNVLPSSTTYIPPPGWLFKPLGEAIAELGATLDGPDWRVRPIEFSGGYYGELDIAPIIGASRPDLALEYGDGKLNLSAFKRAVSFEGALTRAFHLPPGYPDNAAQQPLTREDTGAQAARGLLEGLVSADLTSDDLRGKLLDAHIAVRARGRQTFELTLVRDVTPTGERVPRFGIGGTRDFDLGDLLPFRASTTRNGELVKRADVIVRVYAFAVTVDDAGVAVPTLTVSPSTT